MPIAPNVTLGENVNIYQPEVVNLYGCSVGDDTKIGAFVEIQKNASVGARCKISSHTFICDHRRRGFCRSRRNVYQDRYPRATTSGQVQTEADWQVVATLVKRGASVGSGAVILCGITIGEKALIGAGAVVTHDVPDHAIVVGYLRESPEG